MAAGRNGSPKMHPTSPARLSAWDSATFAAYRQTGGMDGHAER
jgi:hypothetical protein